MAHTMNLKDVLRDVPCRIEGKAASFRVRAVTDDSRSVIPGSLFIAKRGYSQDGSKFIADAFKRGARVVVTEGRSAVPAGAVKIMVKDTRTATPVIADNFYGHPSEKLKMVGITGTNGKTTITYILEGIVKAAGAAAGVIGTINYRVKNKVTPAKNTTPGPIELQSILSRMVRSGAGYAVMEVSSHALDQGRVDKVSFDAAICTNVTGDHLDYHKTMENYFKAKALIFKKLKRGGAAILNGDDKRVARLKRSITKNKVLMYGTGKKADVRAEDIKLSMDGTTFTIVTQKRSFAVRTKLIGMHNVSNILAATAAALALGIRIDSIVKGIGKVMAVPGRLEAVDAGQPFKVFVDFAHTEDALFNVLTLLREVAGNRIVTVFGCGGNRDRTKRPRMGKVACELSDRVIVTSDNPRFENPGEIISEIEKGIKTSFSNYDIAVDRKEAINKALSVASDTDIILIAGKGHETYQIIKDRTFSFDDREVARSILKKKYDGGSR